MSTSHSSRKFETICVFCGSRPGKNIVYSEAAEHLGQVLADRKINLIYGGGSSGLMWNVASAAHSRGSSVVGIIPYFLAKGNLCGKTIGKEEKVLDISMRLDDMIQKSDAFIALPGGLGTLEELFVVASRSFLGIHSKPIGLLNINGFYDGLLKFLDFAVEQSFVIEPGRKIFITASTVEELLVKMQVIGPEGDTASSKLDSKKPSRKRPLDIDLDLHL